MLATRASCKRVYQKCPWPFFATVRLPERDGLRYRMGEYECSRYATVSREGIDHALQIFRLCKRAADYKAVVTGDADDIQDLRYGFEQRDVPLNVLMRRTHPYDGLKSKANGP